MTPGVVGRVLAMVLADQIEIAVRIHRDPGAIGRAAVSPRALEVQVAEESGIEQMGAGGIEGRDESELGVASGRFGSADYRAGGGWKAGITYSRAEQYSCSLPAM